MGTIGDVFTIGRELDIFNPSILLACQFSIVSALDLQSVSVKEKTCTISITNCDKFAIWRPVKRSRIVG